MLFSLASCAALVSLAAFPRAHAVDIPVIVGGDGILAYNPPSVTANVGDKIVFQFQVKNHTATQSTFEAPCVPAPGGFDSGFVPVAATDTPGSKTAIYTVVDTNPVWVYCRQGTHCQSGMVFAVNPGDKLAQFQANAKGGASPSAAYPPAAPSVTSPATSATPSSGTTPGQTNDHKVIVGGPGQLTFNPSNITAKAGDTVTFEFHQKNHTVTQSSLAAPCSPLAANATNGQVGFDSGFKPVPDSSTSFPTFTIQVNDTKPIWAYCAQTSHCSSGMVFSVNAAESGDKSFETFKDIATGKTKASGAIKMPNGVGLTCLWVAAAFVLLL